MNFLNFFANLNGDIIKNKLIASGIVASPYTSIYPPTTTTASAGA